MQREDDVQTGGTPRKGRARRQAAPLPGAPPVSRERGSRGKRPEKEHPRDHPQPGKNISPRIQLTQTERTPNEFDPRKSR